MASRTTDCGGGITAEWDDSQQGYILYFSYNGTGTGIMKNFRTGGYDAPWCGSSYKSLPGMVMFDEGIKQIGDYCCYGLDKATAVFLPETCISIGKGSFMNTQIDDIQISTLEQLTTIKSWAFRNTAISLVHIPKSVTTIGDAAFMNNQNLELLWFDDDCPITTIPYGCFQHCRNLTNSNRGGKYQSKIVLPKKVVLLGDYAFEDCPKIEGFYLQNTAQMSFGTSSLDVEGQASSDMHYLASDGTWISSATIPAAACGYSKYFGISWNDSMRVMVGAFWHNGTPYVNVNGTWKQGKAYVNVNGTWHTL